MSIYGPGDVRLPRGLKAMNYGGYVTFVDKDRGVGPIFSTDIKRRINKKLAANVAVTGEAGISKSYTAIFLAMLIDKTFSVDQIVFEYSEFMDQLIDLKMGKPIVFDEPSYAMSKRDWYQELNKALVKTMESMRFKVHPLFIPVINMNLLDRTVRKYLIQYVVFMTDRGVGDVYKVFASQWKDSLYRYTVCGIRLGLFQKNRCAVDTCLGCKEKGTCDTIRAQYERKKEALQDQRYERAKDEAIIRESREYTNKELAALAYAIRDRCKNDNDERLDTIKLIVAMELEYEIKLSHFKGQVVRKMLEAQHGSELFN